MGANGQVLPEKSSQNHLSSGASDRREGTGETSARKVRLNGNIARRKPGKKMIEYWDKDLPGFGLSRLRGAGVGHAEWTGHCTYHDEARFFSYRRTTHRREPDYGRLISAIRL